MSRYSFSVKMGKYQLDLSTTDRDFVDSQFEVWIKQAGAFAKRLKSQEGREHANAQIKKESEITQKKIDQQLSKYQTKGHSNREIKEDNKSTKQENLVVENDKNEKNTSLDIFYSPNNTINKGAKSIPEGGVFDNILENSLSNPSTELSFKPNPNLKKDNAFLNYISSKKIEKKIDYLLMTAYYFSEFEQRPRFTLKQLNAKLMQNIAVIIDHGVVQEAINRDYLECLPDLTGLIGASEYRLTAYGEKVLLES